jgi:hypothetical protein
MRPADRQHLLLAARACTGSSGAARGKSRQTAAISSIARRSRRSAPVEVLLGWLAKTSRPSGVRQPERTMSWRERQIPSFETDSAGAGRWGEIARSKVPSGAVGAIRVTTSRPGREAHAQARGPPVEDVDAIDLEHGQHPRRGAAAALLVP